MSAWARMWMAKRRLETRKRTFKVLEQVGDRLALVFEEERFIVVFAALATAGAADTTHIGGR